MLELLVPKRSHEDFRTFWDIDDFCNRPHQCAVDSHQFVMINLVGFVQDNANFVFVSVNGFNASAKFVGDVQFVCVEKENDSVNAFREPLKDSYEIVPVEKIRTCIKLMGNSMQVARKYLLILNFRRQ